jgi:signal transduction histidine kinase
MIMYGGSFLLPESMPSIPIEILKKIEFLVVYAIVAVLPLYLYHLFPAHASKKVVLFFIIFSVLLCLLVLATPIHIYSMALDVALISTVAGLGYGFIIISRALRAGNKDARIILFGLLVCSPFVLIEALQNSHLLDFEISFAYLVEVGLLFFLLFQTYLLAHHYSLAYKKLEESHDELESKVEMRTSELVKANHVKERLLSIISHDLRSPLNSLKAILTLHKADQISSDQLRDLNKLVEDNLNNTSLLLDNVLSWSAMQIKGVELAQSSFSLKELVQQHVQIFQPIADRKSIVIKNNLTDFSVFTDSNIISLVLRNLVANAIKFSYPNQAIEIDGRISANHFELTVTDHGKGMTVDEVSKLLNKSFHRNGTQNESGTGMGLQLSREYLTYIDGEIKIKSEKERGSVFTLVVPFGLDLP